MSRDDERFRDERIYNRLPVRWERAIFFGERGARDAKKVLALLSLYNGRKDIYREILLSFLND